VKLLSGVDRTLAENKVLHDRHGISRPAVQLRWQY